MLKRLSILLIPILTIAGCAQQGSPSGGAIDEDPPVVVECEPVNYSNWFDAEKILITFDEYIVLNNVNQEMIVSPPLNEKPEIKLRKKTIVISFGEELKENTTYTFNFGNAIEDLHEGNVLENYEYVLATGEVVDSLSVKGTLRDAFELTPPEGPITVMLYTDLRDSVPLLDIPYYIGKSDKEGNFSVNNLKSEIYKLFALQDANYNFLFDQPNEMIAYLDTSLIVSAEYFKTIFQNQGTLDSIQQVIDSAMIAADSAFIDVDSLKSLASQLNSVYVDLFLFVEETGTQYLSDYNRDEPRKLEFIFNKPLKDSFDYKIIDLELSGKEHFLEVFGLNRDTLTLWVKDSVLYKRDTLAISFTYTVMDTINLPALALDTVYFSYRKKTTRRERKEEKEEIPALKISTIKPNSTQDLYAGLKLEFNYPVTGTNPERITLFQIPDSVEQAVPFAVQLDTISFTRAYIDYAWESDMKYKISLYPGAFKNLYEFQHDTLIINFKGQDIEHYGRILLNLENVTDEIIIQLRNKDEVIREKKINTSGQVVFPYLEPQTYNIKIIHDKNRNGKWDTGKYIKNIQPERVEILPSEITVRSNWDHDATYGLKY